MDKIHFQNCEDNSESARTCTSNILSFSMSGERSDSDVLFEEVPFMTPDYVEHMKN
jgi:hypothetical protein